MTEITIQKKYKTLNGFVRGCRAALKKIFGHDDDLTTIVTANDGMTTHLEYGGQEYIDVLTQTGDLVMSEGGSDWKRGFDFRFSEGFIYIYNIEE